MSVAEIMTPASPAFPDQRIFGAPDEEEAVRQYRGMYLIRRFEQRLLQLFEEGVLNGTTHACIGQEADCVGVMQHLRSEDHVFSNHRCHGHYLARTGDIRGLLAEIMGRPEGICSGLGGSQHICAPGFKSNGVQGGIVPNAAGIAMAEKLRGTKNISVVFIGDGTLGEGMVYETMNIASLWKLPLLVIVEDNQWAQSTPRHRNFAGDMKMRFEAFGLNTIEISSTDVQEVSNAAKTQVEATRSSGTAHVLVIHTYRLCHHSKNDDARPEAEVKERWNHEPLRVHGPRISKTQLESVESEVEEALSEAIEELKELA